MPISFWRIVFFFIGTIAVIFAAYYVSYFLGKKTMKTGSGRNIRLRDRFSVSKDKSFCLLEVKGKIYLVAMTNQSATLLDTYKSEDFGEDAEAKPKFWPSKASGTGERGVPPGWGTVFDGGAIRNAAAQVVRTIRGASKHRAWSPINDLDRRVTLQMAQEEDGIDIVYRKMQARRAEKKDPFPEEDGE